MSSIEAKYDLISSFFKVLILFQSLIKWKTNCHLCLYWTKLIYLGGKTEIFITGNHRLLSYHHMVSFKSMN